MPWLQLKLDTTAAQSEQLEDLLMDSGALSVTLEDNADQPLFEPKPGEMLRWDQTRLTGLYKADTDMQHVVDFLTQHTTEPLPPYRIELLEDKDWERAWIDNFQPIQCGKRLWICPSWKPAPETAEVKLRLDPGLAFGTGTHETTFLCLEWLDGALLQDKEVIDYGCGSGILGIAALLLGANHVIGVDNDPQALLATRDNAERNGVADKFEVFLPGSSPNNLVDILIANILMGPLIELAETFAQRVTANGVIVLSGILASQADDIATAYAPWFDIDHVKQKGDWIRVVAKRKS